jgi:probable rRNA maturation factor
MPRSQASATGTVALTVEHGAGRVVPRTEIRRRIDAMIALLQLHKNDISFVLTNDKSIHHLNKVYRGKDRPTDVLAFALHEGDFAELAGDALGDVIVSVETARKQARERGSSVLEEVTMLLAHGLLHLLGWDHDTPAKDRRMRAETDRLCVAARAQGRSRGKIAASKGGADRALSRKPLGERKTKLEASHVVKARRSRKT